MTRSILKSVALAVFLAAGAAPVLAQGTAFTYQGQLKSDGQPVDSSADFEFRLFTTAIGGSQLGSSVVQNGVSVTSGLFATPVDFGVNPYTSNQALFLEIAVRNPAGSGSFVTLGSRQPLTPAPFSLATRGINVNAAGDVALLTGIDRRISVANPPLNANGTNLTILAGNANSFGNATDGGDLVLEAGRAFNATQSFVRPGDVFIRSGGNSINASNAPNGGDIIMQTGGAFNAVTERMRVTQNGNVGIGSTSPRALLDVVRPQDTVTNTPAGIMQVNTCGAPCGQPNYTEALRLINVGVAGGLPNGAGQVGIGMSPLAAATATSTADIWLGTGFPTDAGDGTNDFIIATKTSPTALTNRVRVNGDNGNVGIGTDAPAARLHNVGTTRIDDALQFGVQNFTGTAGSNARIYRFGAGGNGSNLYLDMTSTTGSSFILQGNGNDRFSFDIGTGAALKTGGGAWGVLSDERTKTNIQTMTGTLDRLLQLKGHAYTYKPEFVEDGRALPGTQIGLVAQEVETVFPDWVTTGADGLKQVTERSTTALMVEALRDLRTEKDAEINDLKARLEKLEALLNAQSK